MTEHQILERLLPYVPPYWVRQAAADPTRTLVGREERIYGAVLFVDISGFTPMSEALSRKGREGVGELSRILGRYFTVMGELVLADGGEVVKFAGDSLIVIFPAQIDRGEAHLGSALHCALRMQEAMAQFAVVRTSSGVFPLRVKIGISEGRLYNTTVGDEEQGMQSVFAGLPLARCMEAEGVATAGEIVVDAALLSRTPGRLDVGESRGTFRLIVGASGVPVLPPTTQMGVSDLTAEQAELLFRRLAPYLPGQLVDRIRQGHRGLYGEYRRVTIMFVKFGGLNYDWDPDVGSVLQTHFRTMRDCVTRHGGRLNEVDIVSDGGTLVVFFGAPTAHEDDETRAVACAWEMQQAVADVRLEAGEAASQLRQRIGISSSPVFFGDVGASTRRTYATVGDEVNLASRLMNLAHWGEVVVTGWVERGASGRFEFEAMGETRVKGKSDLVTIHALVGPCHEGVEGELWSRLMDRRPLIGREEELAGLGAVADEAWQGRSQLVLVAGEAGLGKTRLVGKVMQKWTARGGHAYVGDCRLQGTDGEYVPWRSLLRVAFGLRDTDSSVRQLERIETLLTFVSPSLARRADLFIDLLGVGGARGPFIPPPWAVERRVQLHDLLIDFVRMISQRQPILLIFENMHDIDDLSLALLGALLDSLEGFPVLVCASYRPHRGAVLPQDVIPTTLLVLDDLAEPDSLVYARNLLVNAGLPLDLAAQIVAQTQGNPFYLQEMVHALTDATTADGLDAAQILALGRDIPTSISDTVRAQLDHLDEESKLILRIAAVAGREFSVGVLLAAHPGPISPQDLSAHLASLERMHVLRMEQMGSDVRYAFKHPMTRRVIYAGMLRADRERTHLWVAEAIEEVAGHELEHHYRTLADHFQRGNAVRKAALYYLLSGHRAVEMGADREALAHYDRAEEVLAGSDGRRSRCDDGVRVALLLRRASVHRCLVNTAQAMDDLRRAAALAGRLLDLGSMGEALLGQAEIALHQARYLDATNLLRRAMQPFSSLADREAMSRTLLLIARIQGLQGHYSHAVVSVERALAPGDEALNGPVLADCKCWQGAIFYATGRYREAMEALDRAIQLGRSVGAQDVVVQALSTMAQVLLSRGRWGRAIQSARQALETSHALSSPLAKAEAQRVLALVYMHVGAFDRAQQLVGEALSMLASAEWRVELASAFWIAGEVCFAQAQYKDARQRFENALALGRESGTVEAVVNGQLGLSKLSVAEADWSYGQRLCTEARARARRASLEPGVVAARLAMTRVHIARQDWRRAQYEAMQAYDASTRLRCPYEVSQAAALLGEALVGLGQSSRSHRYFSEASAIIEQLASTLPQSMAAAFLEQSYVRGVQSRAGERCTGEVA
jgi:class 3 adenylate cyclase/tetratricopeptide (TPR) repeat protein